MANEELEGNTLAVYAFIAHANRPVGTRAVMRGANLSSPSVAHRHLQKLEDLGLIERNHYGDYVLKEKTGVNGYVWVGRNLVPRLLFYSFFFIGAFSAEIAILLFDFCMFGLAPNPTFAYLTAITAISIFSSFSRGFHLIEKSKIETTLKQPNPNFKRPLARDRLAMLSAIDFLVFNVIVFRGDLKRQ